MDSYIKIYLKIISWRIFVICIVAAMLMTSLFPFDNLSMAYIFSLPVLKVMLKTFVIASLLFTAMNFVSFYVFRSRIWQTNVIHACFYQGFLGVIIPFICGLSLIRYFYGSAIFVHEHFNRDLMLMLMMLVLCNLIMVIRMYAFYFNDKSLSVLALKANIKDLNADHELIKEASKSKHEDELQALKITIDRLNKDLHISLINTEKCVLEAQLRDNQWQDKVDSLLKEIADKSTTVTDEFDEQYMQHMSHLLLEDRENEVYDPLKIYEFRSEMKDSKVINEDQVAVIYGVTREGVFCQDIYLLDGEVYTVYGSTLEEMNKIFPRMVRISRNHLIPGRSIVSFEVMSSKLVKVNVIGLEHPIEMKYDSIRKVFSWVILQYVWNQYREKQSSPAVSF